MAENAKGIAMQREMKGPIKKATGATVTNAQNYQRQFYLKECKQSNLKLQIGYLMFDLQQPLNHQKRIELQQFFETILIEFINLKYGRIKK